MRPFELALAMAVGLGPAVAQAEPDTEQRAEQDDEQGETSTMVEEPPLSDSGRIDVISEPRGELVRLSQLPEAELMVDVTLTSNDERAYFEVNSDKTGASLLICGTPCQFRIWPGRYRLITNASSGYMGGSNQFVVERNSKVQIVEPRVYRPVLGALVGSIGIASAIIGGILLAASPCGSDCDRTTATRSQIGLATLGGGLVLTPAGWILFAQSRKPDIVVNPFEPEKRE